MIRTRVFGEFLSWTAFLQRFASAALPGLALSEASLNFICKPPGLSALFSRACIFDRWSGFESGYFAV